MSRRRKNLKISSSDLAARLGVSRRSLSTWENPTQGILPQDLDVLAQWCEELGLTVGEALAGKTTSSAELIGDPEHLRSTHIFYQRYHNERSFARLAHRAMAADKKTLEKLDALLDIPGNINFLKALEWDRRWEEINSHPPQSSDID